MGSDMRTSDQPFLRPTRSDLPLEIRAYVIQLLQQTLVSTIDLRSQVKQAGWNVKGRELSQLHTLFGTIASELDAYADLLAERIAVLGGVAWGTVRVAAMQSTLLEYPDNLVAGDAHVRALADRVAPYAAALRADITHAADVEDAVTAALYTDIVRGVEKRLWGLDAHCSC
jgi:starvation-inducible DNA-binding protein